MPAVWKEAQRGMMWPKEPTDKKSEVTEVTVCWEDASRDSEDQRYIVCALSYTVHLDKMKIFAEDDFFWEDRFHFAIPQQVLL